jgi:hypothetical protein
MMSKHLPPRQIRTFRHRRSGMYCRVLYAWWLRSQPAAPNLTGQASGEEAPHQDVTHLAIKLGPHLLLRLSYAGVQVPA